MWTQWVKNDSIAKPFTFTVSGSKRYPRQWVKLKVIVIQICGNGSICY